MKINESKSGVIHHAGHSIIKKKTKSKNELLVLNGKKGGVKCFLKISIKLDFIVSRLYWFSFVITWNLILLI